METRAAHSKHLRQIRWCAETNILIVKVCLKLPSRRIAKAGGRDIRAISRVRQGKGVDEGGQGSTYVVRDVRQMDSVVDPWIFLPNNREIFLRPVLASALSYSDSGKSWPTT